MSKERGANGYFTQEFKEGVLARLGPPINDTVSNLAEELGVSKSAIYHWIRLQKGIKNGTPATRKWSSEDKFHIVVETSTLAEHELSAYCRRKGLFVGDVKSWREQCIKANSGTSRAPLKMEEDLREEKQKSRILEQELRRKEKALAETAALLVLRKKAQAIWGDPEEG